MGSQERHFSFCRLREAPEHLVVGTRVWHGRRPAQNVQLRIPQVSTRQGVLLPFSTGEVKVRIWISVTIERSSDSETTPRARCEVPHRIYHSSSHLLPMNAFWFLDRLWLFSRPPNTGSGSL
jgi:hypothetical protein